MESCFFKKFNIMSGGGDDFCSMHLMRPRVSFGRNINTLFINCGHNVDYTTSQKQNRSKSYKGVPAKAAGQTPWRDVAAHMALLWSGRGRFIILQGKRHVGAYLRDWCKRRHNAANINRKTIIYQLKNHHDSFQKQSWHQPECRQQKNYTVDTV